MLNITRKIGEKIVIGDDIVLEVMEVSGSSVRIGIQAPRSVPVYREEIWEAVRAENAAAAQSSPSKLPKPPGAPAGRVPGCAPPAKRRRPSRIRPATTTPHPKQSLSVNQWPVFGLRDPYPIPHKDYQGRICPSEFRTTSMRSQRIATSRPIAPPRQSQ